MMKHFRKSGGFTLVELVVSIAVASLVTMAATTVLMLALRVNRQTSDTATQQYTVRALLTAMEKAATSGSIQKVTSNLGSWQMLKNEAEETHPVFEYDAFEREILSNGIVVMENVFASNAILEHGLLSISIETKEGTFETTVYCRLGIPEKGDSTQPTAPTNPGTALDKFLAILISQRNSNGKINYESLKSVLSEDGNDYVPRSNETYYSEWYIGKEIFAQMTNDWNPETPWCACYVSWALVEAGIEDPTDRVDTNGRKIQWYSNVDKFLDYLKQENKWKDRSEAGKPGDLVFFDWIPDDGVEDPQHVGVVLQVDDECIITIEGNSAGHVAVRSYPLDDTCILGYGLLAGLETE